MQKTRNATLLLCKSFGWQGGTIHQVAEITGLTAEQILSLNTYPPSNDGKICDGFSARLHCPLEINLRVNFPKNRGVIAYWAGVVRGQEFVDEGAPSIYK